MNIFIEELKQRGLDYVLNDNPFIPIAPKNSDRFADLVQEIVKNNLSVYIDPDCDPDGYFSARIIKTMFDKIGYTNYIVGQHDHKRHSVRKSIVASLAQQGIDVFILLDSSTNDISLFEFIVSLGCRVACIDHHSTDHSFGDYPESAIIINPVMEHFDKGISYNELSAGALCALVASYTLKTRYNVVDVIELYLYGVITLYSDSCNLAQAYNIAFIRAFQNQQIIPSDIIQMFLTPYSHFDRSFISFYLIPRINALMRLEKFDMLYKLFFQTHTIADKVAFVQEVDEIYKYCKVYTQKLVESCKIDQHKNYVVAILPDGTDFIARNFTGLVANSFADKYNQTCLCLFPSSPTQYGGSVRDPFNRNVLPIFYPYMYAEGHPSAFGVSLDRDKLSNVCLILDSLDDMFESKQEDIIIIPWDGRPFEDIRAEMQMMSEYNEFSGGKLPKALGIMTVKNSFKIYVSQKYTTIYGGGCKFTCFVKLIGVGDILIATPTSNGSEYKLIVNNVKYTQGE